MGSVHKKILLYTQLGSGVWDESNPVDLSSYAYDCEVRKAINNSKDKFSLRLPKGDTYYSGTDPVVENGDLVRIWMKRDSVTYTDSDMAMEGVVDSVSQDIDTTTNSIKVSGFDFFEAMFDVQIPVSIIQKNTMEALQELMEEADFASKNLFWASAAYGYTGTPNPTTKVDGTSFPLFDLSLNYTPFCQIVEKITADEYTDDGQYYYFVEADPTSGRRYLVVRTTKDTMVGTLSEGAAATLSQSPMKINVTKEKTELKNFIIFYAGTDLKGNSIQDVYYDLTSIGKNGFKYYYMVEETGDVAKTVIYDEASANESSFNFSGGKWTATQDYYPTSYPYTWSKLLDGATVISANDDEFNDDYVDICKQQARQVANQFAEGTSKVKYKTVIEYLFRNDLTMGKLYTMDLPSRGISRDLRVSEAVMKVNGTTYTFEEDNHRAES